MKNNMGTKDKVIKTIAAVIIVVLYFTHVITGILAIVLLVVAAVFVLTSLISNCPIYPLFGINTRKKK